MAKGQPNPLNGNSVIFLFQQGGPSQHETFDPKPDAPSGARSVGEVIPTSVPGIHFSGWMPRLAGVTRPKSGVPTNVVLFPRSVDAHVPGLEARGNISATGPSSKGFASFIPGKGEQLQDDMNLALSRDRFFEQRKLLAGRDSLNRSGDLTGQVGTLDEIQQQAAEVLLGGGFDGGRVIGQSDRMGGELVTDAFKPRHLISTVLRSVIDPGQLRLLSNVPMEVTELLDHPPITGLG